MHVCYAHHCIDSTLRGLGLCPPSLLRPMTAGAHLTRSMKYRILSGRTLSSRSESGQCWGGVNPCLQHANVLLRLRRGLR